MQKLNPKKRLAFILTTFVVGGVERSFLDLLDCINQSKYDVTVFLPDDEGEWTPLLQEKCKVKYLKIENFKTVFSSQFCDGHIYSAFRSLFFRLLARLNYKKNYRKSTEYFIRSMSRVKEKFDCAVAYQIINDDCVLGCLYRIKASKKVVWSHLDMNKSESLYNDWYGKFDRIFCVSNYSKEEFVNNFPQLKDKTEVLYNAINPTNILQGANWKIDIKKSEEEITLVTVARLTQVKGQNMIPRAARLLIDAGFQIKWYLIGEGNLREEIQRNIQEERVENSVILLGNMNNPYPYMRACDIYVQTSLVEGWGLTVSEAKVLNKPIVTTDAGVMSEQIQNGVNGIIVSEATSEALATGILRLIKHPEQREAFVQHLQQEDVCHTREIEKLYCIMDE